MVADQHYTKHFYNTDKCNFVGNFIETERIASKPCTERSRSVGGGFGMVDNPVDQGFAIAPLEGSLEDHSDNLQQHIINSFSCSADVELGAEIELHGIESFVTQTSSCWESRYSFSGKEKDVETGYSYTSTGSVQRFGARYSTFAKAMVDMYDSDLSVWLSACPRQLQRRRMDSLADQFPHQSPFMY